MGLRAIQVASADAKAKNVTGNNWVPVQQIAAGRCRLFNLTVFVPTNVGANRVVWLFDQASGDETSVNPDLVFVCIPGATQTLKFDGGRLFQNGLLLVVSTAEPPDANTAPTKAANNEALATSEYRMAG